MINSRNLNHLNPKLNIFREFAIVIAIVFLLSCGVWEMINSKDDFFHMVKTLSEQRPFDPRKIEELTARNLEKIQSESNEYFLVYKSVEEKNQYNDVISIELRVPTSKSSCEDGILIFELEPEACIDQNDIIGKYGLGEPSPPDPNMPREIALFYLSYTYDWGQLSYGFKVIGQECLNSVVLDATKQ
jgi:hypothetical protein